MCVLTYFRNFFLYIKTDKDTEKQHRTIIPLFLIFVNRLLRTFICVCNYKRCYFSSYPFQQQKKSCSEYYL